MVWTGIFVMAIGCILGASTVHSIESAIVVLAGWVLFYIGERREDSTKQDTE